MSERYLESGFGKRTLENSEHWIPLEIDNFRITNPTILCIQGNGTIDYAKAMRFCANSERMVGFKQKESGCYRNYKHVNVLGFHYGMDNEFKEDGSKSDTGFFSKEDRDKIVDNLFIPLCINSNGKKKSVSEACKNFSNVIVYVHCHGAKEIGMMMADLNYKLYKAGFKMEEIEKIMSYGFQISYSPFTEESWLPNVKIYSFTDSLNGGLDALYKKTYGEELDGVAVKYDKKGERLNEKKFYIHQDGISVYATQLINTKENNDPTRIIDEHSYETLERNNDWSIANGAKCADCVSQMQAKAFEIAFENAVENSYMNYKLMLRPPMPVIAEKLEGIKNMFKDEDLKSTKVKISKSDMLP